VHVTLYCTWHPIGLATGLHGQGFHNGYLEHFLLERYEIWQLLSLTNRNLFPKFRELWSAGPVIPCGNMHQSFTRHTPSGFSITSLCLLTVTARSELRKVLFLAPSVCGFMAALCNRADHYIFVLWFPSFFFFLSSFPRLISAVADCMSTILLHRVWP